MRKITFMFFVLALVSTVSAAIDYNMVYDTDGMGYDEVNGKYRVKLQVKSDDGDVPVGFFNLRILYNNAGMAFNIAESYSLGPIEDHDFFDLQVYDLIPVEMSSIKCGINGIYIGPNTTPMLCYMLDNTWTDCAVMVFDVVNAAETVNLRWDDSGVQNQITDYSASPIANGTFNGDHDTFISDDTSNLVKVYIRAFLGGTLTPGNFTMHYDLHQFLPLTSPYEDSLSIPYMPNYVVDWVSIELRQTADGPTIEQRSALLLNTGIIADVRRTTINNINYVAFRNAAP